MHGSSVVSRSSALLRIPEAHWQEEVPMVHVVRMDCYNLVRPYFIFLFFLSCLTLSSYLLSGT